MIKEKTCFWLLLFSLIIFFLYQVRDILLPFIVGLIFAYALNPLVNKLAHFNIKRTNATAIISILFFMIITLILFKILPLIYTQIELFIKNIPVYREFIHSMVIPKISSFIGKLDPSIVYNIEESFKDISSIAFKYLGQLMTNIWQSGIALVNIISLLFVTPIITFYLIRDWTKINTKINSWLPLQYRTTIKEQLRLIDRALSGFLRGQALISIFLACFYSISLSIVGLQFSLFIGIATGILVFIPYVGFLIGASIGIIVAIIQFKDITMVIIVASIFIAGQIIEGNFLTPKIMNDKVGLHPIWVFFALLAGGSLFGFSGVLFAIPVAAVLGVLGRFSIKQYLNSSFYK